MKTKVAACALTVLLLAAALISPAASAVPTYMEPRDVKAGMTGYGLTVFEGDEPANFDFTVLAVTRADVSGSEVIIVKVSGSQVEKIGGIAAGMSGSPCYIGGKLVGALSHVLEGPDPKTGIITPMSAMVKLLEIGKLAGQPSSVEVPGWGSFVPATAPIWVGGLSQRALDKLKQGLKARGFAVEKALSLGISSGDDKEGTFVAGSSIAVQMSYGDVEAGSIGTLTWTDGSAFLAYGHPMLNIGEVSLPMSKSTVLAVLPSDSFPFKLGTFEKPIAAVTQDRSAGLAGALGRNAATVALSVKVNDMQTGRRKNATIKCVPDERLIADLVGSAVLSTVDATMMRVGEGTAFISVLVKSLGGQLLREDMVWSASDVADMAAAEVADIISLIVGNDVETAQITSVAVNMDIAPARLTSVITGVKLPKEGFVPGMKQTIEITIRPFRGAEYTKLVDVELPVDTKTGSVTVVVYGGASEEEGDSRTLTDKLPDTGGMPLSDLFDAIASVEQNNELIIEIYYDNQEGIPETGMNAAADDEGASLAAMENSGVPTQSDDDNLAFSTRLTLQSVVYGYHTEQAQVM